MSAVQFAIIPCGSEAWAIDVDGKVGGEYATREAAFEAVFGEASNAIRSGEAVEIVVSSSRAQRAKT